MYKEIRNTLRLHGFKFANLILDATIHLPFDDPNSAVKALLVTNMFNDLSLANTFKIMYTLKVRKTKIKKKFI